MKKVLLGVISLCAIMSTHAQTAGNKPTAKPAPSAAAKPKPTTPAKPVAKPGLVLKNSLDSLSYAIGVLDAGFFKQQGIETLNYTMLAAAVKAVLENKEPLMTPQMADMTLRQKLQDAAMKKIQPNIDEGAAFCAENKKRNGVVETPSGLQYEVLKMGDGPKPADTSTVKVHYVGTLLNGTKFDSSRDRGEPAEFPLNRVIAGWTEGVQLMPVGSIFKFTIPYQLAYGTQGSPPTIPGGATLVFEVELLGISN